MKRTLRNISLYSITKNKVLEVDPNLEKNETIYFIL